jgi:plastocyanin
MKVSLKCLISLYGLMKENIYYAGFLATVLLVFLATGPAISATTTEPTQPLGTRNQTQTSQEGTVRVAVGEGSNATIQHYTYTPQTVEINAGESVTWFTPAELVDIHTVTFVLDQNVLSDIILPFAISGDTSFELLPPFNLGEPIMIQAPDGRQAIVALNKHAWNPAVLDANNQTTFLNGTDIQYTMDGTEKVINSGIILPPMPPLGEATGQNTTAPSTGAEEIPPGAAETNETTSQATEEGGGQPPIGPPFPPVSSFTVTFEEPGRYPYFCAIHPWMGGEVIVAGGEGGENQTGTQAQNQTEAQGENQADALTALFE